jgi:hypothetical protein
MAGLGKAAGRSRGTVAFKTARDVLASNAYAWDQYAAATARGHDAARPALRIDRREVMRRLGAHQRTLQTDLDRPDAAPQFDLDLDDEALGSAVWEAVKADAQIRHASGNAGYEMTTCPKSCPSQRSSPRTTPASSTELIRDASGEALSSCRVGHACNGHDGDGWVAPAIRGLGYATVSVEPPRPDPHLHGHVMIPNRVLCVDGKERGLATGGTDLMNHSWWLQAQFERRLRALSIDRGMIAGWEMDHRTRQWEVTGADPDVMAFFSQDTPRCRPRSENRPTVHRWP